MKRPGRTVLVLTFLLQVSIASDAATITTPEIVAKTTAATLTCVRWMPVGACFWLQCSVTGCRVRTSVKVAHYNPDLIVSVYNELGGNPWAEIRATLGLAQQTAAEGLLGLLLPVPIDSAGNRTEGTANRRDHRNLVFRWHRPVATAGVGRGDPTARHRLAREAGQRLRRPHGQSHAAGTGHR